MITLADVDKKITVFQNLLKEKTKYVENLVYLMEKMPKIGGAISPWDINQNSHPMEEEFFYSTYSRQVVFVCFIDMCRLNINAFMRAENRSRKTTGNKIQSNVKLEFYI